VTRRGDLVDPFESSVRRSLTEHIDLRRNGRSGDHVGGHGVPRGHAVSGAHRLVRLDADALGALAGIAAVLDASVALPGRRPDASMEEIARAAGVSRRRSTRTTRPVMRYC
jgi:hypothetical protein